MTDDRLDRLVAAVMLVFDQHKSPPSEMMEVLSIVLATLIAGFSVDEDHLFLGVREVNDAVRSLTTNLWMEKHD